MEELELLFFIAHKCLTSPLILLRDDVLWAVEEWIKKYEPVLVLQQLDGFCKGENKSKTREKILSFIQNQPESQENDTDAKKKSTRTS